MRLAVIGSRTFTDADLLASVLGRVKTSITEVISGGAAGADSLAAAWARTHGVKLTEYVPDWRNLDVADVIRRTRPDGTVYNARAGHDRNALIIDQAEAVIAFWDGASRGTLDSITRARVNRIPIWVVRFDQPSAPGYALLPSV